MASLLARCASQFLSPERNFLTNPTTVSSVLRKNSVYACKGCTPCFPALNLYSLYVVV